MKDQFDKFYKGNESVFSVLGVTLITAGLILNVPKSSGLIGDAIEHLKFLFLIISALLLVYLVFIALQILLSGSYITNQGATFHHQTRNLSIRIFFIALGLLMAIDFFIFIIFSYPHELIYMFAISIGLFILVQLSKIPIKKVGMGRIWHIFITVFIFAILCLGYIYLYRGNINLLINTTVAFVILAVIICIISYIKSRKNLMGDKDHPIQSLGATEQQQSEVVQPVSKENV